MDSSLIHFLITYHKSLFCVFFFYLKYCNESVCCLLLGRINHVRLVVPKICLCHVFFYLDSHIVNFSAFKEMEWVIFLLVWDFTEGFLLSSFCYTRIIYVWKFPLISSLSLALHVFCCPHIQKKNVYFVLVSGWRSKKNPVF